MESEKVYHDSKGWRKLNPHPQFVLHGQHNEINPEWHAFEQSIRYHEFPNPPEVKPGEVVIARLQWQYFDGIYKEWKPSKMPHTDKAMGYYIRQIWVSANQSNQEEKEEQPKDFQSRVLDWLIKCFGTEIAKAFSC